MYVLFRGCVICSDDSVLADCTFMTDEEKEVLITNIKHRLTPHPVKIRAGMDVMKSWRGWYWGVLILALILTLRGWIFMMCS